MQTCGCWVFTVQTYVVYLVDCSSGKYAVQVDYIPVDLKKTSQLYAFYSQVNQLYPDGIDILINNAGE